MELLRVIERVASKMSPGRAPTFNEAQIVKALEIIGDCGPVGRIRLSKKLELGEGVTRTLLKHLKNEKMIKIARHGVTFSKHGSKLFFNLTSKISGAIEVPNSPLTVGPFNVAILVRNVAHGVRKGVEQRDVAIKVGARGATTLLFSRESLTIPSVEENVFKSTSSISSMLVSQLSPKENDVIIIGSGESKNLAELGAKMAAINLLKTEN